jgi:hypothetical protein
MCEVRVEILYITNYKMDGYMDCRLLSTATGYFVSNYMRG